MKRTANKLVHPIFYQINQYKRRIILSSCMIQCIFLLNMILEVLLSSDIICILCEAIKHAFYKIDMKTETLKIILIRVNDNNVRDIK